MPVITIKNIRHSAFASQETECFSAIVYVDGKRAFTARNGGDGGPNRYEPIAPGTSKEVFDLVKSINDGLSTEIVTKYKLQNDLDLVIGQLLNDWQIDKELTKALKRISYVSEGGLYRLPALHKPTPANIELVKKATWWKDSYILLNDLPKDQALAAFKTIDGVA